MRFIQRYLIISLFSMLLAPVSWGADLIQVYHDALKNDPQIQTARAERDETQQDLPQAYANILPQLNAEGTLAFDKQKFHGKTVDNNPPHNLLPLSHEQGTRSAQFSVSLEQSIFNFNNWLQIASARHEVKAAYAKYTAAVQDLIQRTANAYFDLLKARDDVRFTKAEKKALKQQYKQAQANYRVGTKTITDVYNAQAGYDSAKAQYVQAKNELSDKRENLRAITGHYYDHLKAADQLPLVKPDPSKIEQWVKMAHKHNWELKAAKYQMLAAHDSIGAAEANHLPTVNLKGSFRNNYSNHVYNDANKRTKETSASLNVSVPIFSGGRVTSQAKQAIATYNKQASQFAKTNRDVTKATRRSYLGLMSGISSIKANRQAVKSHKSSLKGMREGYKVGTRTIVDVLEAEKGLYDKQRDTAAARYNYLSNLINLKKAAGTLNLTDLSAINDMLDKHHDKNHIPGATKNIALQS